jgi:hypothetical protein
MILLLVMALSILLALVRGGKFAHLAHVSFHYGWLAVLAFAMQIMVIYFPEARMGTLHPWNAFLIPVSYSLLFLVAALNRGLPGVPFVAVGLALNIVVMSLNGGLMPVTFESLRKAGLEHMALGTANGARVMASKDIILSREATRLWFLSDVLVLGEPFPLPTVFSLGDVFLMLGACVLLQSIMLFRPSQSSVVS